MKLLSPARLRRTVSAFAAVATSTVLIFGLAACAPAGNSADLNTDESFEASTIDWRMKIDDCMKQSGFDLTQGGSGDAPVDSIDTSQFDMDEFNKAYGSCIAKVGEPPVDESLPSAEETFEIQLAFAKCMREAGYDYPDPVKESGGMTQAFGPEINPDDVDACGALANEQVSK